MELKDNILLTAEQLKQLHPQPFYKLLSDDLVENVGENIYQWNIGVNKVSESEHKILEKRSTFGLFFTDYNYLKYQFSSKFTKIGMITPNENSYIWKGMTRFKGQDLILSNIIPLVDFLFQNPESDILLPFIEHNRDTVLMDFAVKKRVDYLLNDEGKKSILLENLYIIIKEGKWWSENYILYCIINFIITNKLPKEYLQIDSKKMYSLYKKKYPNVTLQKLQYFLCNKTIIKHIIETVYLDRHQRNYDQLYLLIDKNFENNIFFGFLSVFSEIIEKYSNYSHYSSYNLKIFIKNIDKLAVTSNFFKRLAEIIQRSKYFDNKKGARLYVSNKIYENVIDKIKGETSIDNILIAVINSINE